MKVLGRIDELIGRRARFFTQARESRRAQFDVGDADDVVIGHGDREPLRGFRREGEIFRRAAIGRVERGQLLQSVDIVVAVSHVLEIDDALQARESQWAGAFRQVRSQARDETVELGMARILRQVVEALLRAGVRRLVFPLARAIEGVGESGEARIGAARAFAHDVFVSRPLERQRA